MDDKLISYKLESLNCLERVALYGCSAVTDVDDAAALEVEPSVTFSLVNVAPPSPPSLLSREAFLTGTSSKSN